VDKEKKNKGFKVAFMPSGKRGFFEKNTTVLDAARSLGVDLDSVCGGRAICGRCQIEVSEGKFAKLAISSNKKNITPINESEKKYSKRKHLSQDRRLGCQSKIINDIVIDVPPDSQLHQQLVRKEFEATDITINPITRLYYLNLENIKSDELHKNTKKTITDLLKKDWSLKNIKFASLSDKKIVQLINNSKGCTVAIRNDSELIAVWPNLKENIYGAAIDIGSTTIAINLCNLKDGSIVSNQGSMNPQIRFGEDLMSRVSYCMQNPGSATELTATVRKAINDLIRKACEDTGLMLDDILEITIVGNPVMHHLFLGFDPIPLGVAPFHLKTNKALYLKASELDIKINSQAAIYVLPCLAGHVGADAAAVILAEKPYNQEAMNLIVDVGTNAEIIVGNNQKILAASSPTGPAFEGAQINSGQRAAPGAIERVRINPKNFEAKFKVIGSDLWSNHPEFNNSIKTIGISGICGSGIIEAVAEMYLSGIINEDGLINDPKKLKTDRVINNGRTFSYVLNKGTPDIIITQNDIRAIQLAKAALYAGAKLLMDKLNIKQIDKIRFAGAFGSHIDVKYAMILGMIPDCIIEHVSSAGNAASTGARMALLDTLSRHEIQEETLKIEKIETAVEKKFQEYFVNAMAIPHKSDDFLELNKIVTLPEKMPAAKLKRRKRR